MSETDPNQKLVSDEDTFDYRNHIAALQQLNKNQVTHEWLRLARHTGNLYTQLCNRLAEIGVTDRAQDERVKTLKNSIFSHIRGNNLVTPPAVHCLLLRDDLQARKYALRKLKGMNRDTYYHRREKAMTDGVTPVLYAEWCKWAKAVERADIVRCQIKINKRARVD